MKWNWLWGGEMWADDAEPQPSPKMPPIRLNGWQRLWVVISLGWVLTIGSLAFIDLRAAREELQFLILLQTIPPAFLYVAGLAIAWIRRGFRESSDAPPR